MNKIAVITDTDSSLPPELAERHGIRQVPITIHFDAESYTTGVDIDDAQLFEKVDRLNKLPTTSAPSPGAFSEAYQDAFQQGAESVICICVSSKVSSTYTSALTACDDFPGADISVIDSLNLSMGQGFLAITAAEEAAKGTGKEQILEMIAGMTARLHLYAVLPTLKYLALSGRVGKFVAGMADTFNIKPILTIQDGKLVLLERVRTRKKAIDRTLELIREATSGKTVQRAAVIHINEISGAETFRGLLCQEIHCPDSLIIAPFTPGLSVHAGSGVVGVVLLTDR